MNKTRLAIIATHPIQYYSPWFRNIAARDEVELRVFYLWDFGVTEKEDAGFGHALKWDIPLLEGYEHEFVPNIAERPGTSHYDGLDNPELFDRVAAWEPRAVLCMAYRYRSLSAFLNRWQKKRPTAPLLFRGDSHRLAAKSGVKEWLRRWYISRVFRRFDAALYVGQANRDYFRLHGVPDNRLFFAPHAVDNDRFMADPEATKAAAAKWRAELGVPVDHVVAMFVGKLQKIKRPLDLIEAFKKADPEGATLVMVGSGELEQAARGAAVGDPRIVFAPFQNQTDMPRTYAAADLVVLSSESETWGLAINEAMCLGRAVAVSSMVGCGPDLVHNNRNGFIYPSGDVAELVKKLKDALSDRIRLSKWGAESRTIVSEYCYDKTTEGLIQALRALYAQ